MKIELEKDDYWQIVFGEMTKHEVIDESEGNLRAYVTDAIVEAYDHTGFDHKAASKAVWSILLS